MRLSEAIVLGSFLKPQEFKWFREDGKTCALGAAADAIGIPEFDHEDLDREYHELYKAFPYLHAEAKCPACNAVRGWWRRFRNEEYDLEDVIQHLNDDHRWTRARIAAWVATVEAAQAHEAPKTDDAVARIVDDQLVPTPRV